MFRGHRGFTLIELMIVVVVLGVLVAIALPNYSNIARRAKVAQVKTTMHTLQVTVEDFSSRNDGQYPQHAGVTTAEGAHILADLLPSGGMPMNPFTNAPTALDWTNVLGSVPFSDPAGGVSLNVSQSALGGTYDRYDILGNDGLTNTLGQVLSNY